MRYLSQVERRWFYMIVESKFSIKDWVNDSRNDILSKEAKRWLKTAGTYIEKAAQEIIKVAPQEQIEKLLSDAENYQLVMERKSSLSKEKRDVEIDDLFFVTGQTMYYHCGKECSENKKTSKNCKLRKAMMRMQIPVWETNTNDCPYKGEYESVAKEVDKLD